MTRYFLLLLVVIYLVDASFSPDKTVTAAPASHAVVKAISADSAAIAGIGLRAAKR